MSLKAEPSMVRVWMSIIGYTLRPLIIYVLILVLKYPSVKQRMALAIPAMINGMVALTALFSDISFSYDATNEFVRGPLGFTPHICSGFYLCLILVFSAQLIKGCFLYRTGGDEFMVLCPKNVASLLQLQSMIDSISEEMKKTPYRCSIGMAEYREGESFNALCARADEAMYVVKEQSKRQAEIDK